MYHIVADSGCDIFTLNDESFATVPLTINTKERSFLDDEQLNISEMIEYLLTYKGRSYSACPSTSLWLSAFDSVSAETDEIYVVTLTGGLSGTYNSACVARDIYLESHPNTKIFVLDSLSIGPEVVLILKKISELKKQGYKFDTVCREIKAYMQTTRVFFAFRSLHNLAQNGRVSKLATTAAGVLGISIYGTGSPDGHIEALGKARGDKRVIDTLLITAFSAGYSGGRVCISHAENEPLAFSLRDRILASYPNAEIEINPVRGLCAYYCERGGVCLAVET